VLRSRHIAKPKTVNKKINNEEIFCPQTKIEKNKTKNMKYTEYAIDNDKIEILYSILEKETVIVNCKKIKNINLK
jgi:hypothetical protein